MQRTRPLCHLPLLALFAFILMGGKALAAEQPADNDSGDTATEQENDNSDNRGRPLAYATVDGEPVRGYLARPNNDDGPWPAVILIHDQWGLTKHIRSLAQRFADEGYVALAVDLYAGKTTMRPDRARKLEQTAASDTERSERNLQQAVYYLDLMPSTERIGVIGWGSGGAWSLRTAMMQPQEIAASVLYYAETTADAGRLDVLQSPVLGFYGSDDTQVPEQQAQQLDQALTEAEKTHKIQIYQGAHHDFANPAGEDYSTDTTARAWADTLAFLKRHLKEGSQ